MEKIGLGTYLKEANFKHQGTVVIHVGKNNESKNLPQPLSNEAFQLNQHHQGVVTFSPTLIGN